MTFDKWYNENIEIYNGNVTVTDYMKVAWDAALDEAIDEIRARIDIMNIDKLNIAIDNLKALITSQSS